MRKKPKIHRHTRTENTQLIFTSILTSQWAHFVPFLILFWPTYWKQTRGFQIGVGKKIWNRYRMVYRKMTPQKKNKKKNESETQREGEKKK